MPADFDDQLEVVEELRREVARMAEGEKRSAARAAPRGYERELRVAGLAQRVAQAYSLIEGVLAFIARRIDRAPIEGADWHKALIARCSQPFEGRPTAIPAALADELLELCEFRHVVRNIYPTRLDEAKVRENLRRLIRAAGPFAEACAAFAATVSPARKRRSRAPRD